MIDPWERVDAIGEGGRLESRYLVSLCEELADIAEQRARILRMMGKDEEAKAEEDFSRRMQAAGPNELQQVKDGNDRFWDIMMRTLKTP